MTSAMVVPCAARALPDHHLTEDPATALEQPDLLAQRIRDTLDVQPELAVSVADARPVGQLDRQVSLA